MKTRISWEATCERRERGCKEGADRCCSTGAINAPSEERTEESVKDLVKDLRDGTSLPSSPETA